MVKAKLLKQLRKKIEKGDKSGNSLDLLPKSLLALPRCNGGATNPTKDLQLTYSSAATRSETVTNECLALFEENMGDMYRASSWGFDMTKKADEFNHRKAHFLMLHELGKLAAFCHFRYEYDDEDEPSQTALYVYEIQVAAGRRKQGIGKWIMSVVEAIAKVYEHEKVMLTVFKTNTEATRFYIESLGYQIDETSPSVHGHAEDYEILSKQLSAVE
jgi:ribosomal protein S18 acetylase RimI-like enzyme